MDQNQGSNNTDVYGPFLTPIVSTDKEDYAPGETAVITGSGYTPNSEVIVEITDDPDDPGDDGDVDVYEPIKATVDEFGEFTAEWFVPIDNNSTGSGPPDALNATLNLTATGVGADSIFFTPDDEIASTTFTDALPLTPPVQTYFVPLREDDVFTSFDTIQPNTDGDINTIISVAIAADNTIIYYDHWEDGYEADVLNPAVPGTGIGIWGDQDITNGISPLADTDGDGIVDVDRNQDNVLDALDDVHFGGDAMVLENFVPIVRQNPDGTINGDLDLYDASDRIQATFPIAVTRGAYPEIAGSFNPGTVLAGAVEVLDTDTWGTEFVMPVGEDVPGTSGTEAFEYTGLYVMAGEDNTEVFLNNVSQGLLDTGENFVVRVNQGDHITTSSPVQAGLVTGDIGSEWEVRFYSLAPLADWSNDYYTPVGDGVESGNGNDGPTQVWLYNPDTDNDITVSYDFFGGSSPDGTITVPAGSTALSPAIPDGSGGRFFTAGGEDFFALTQTDSTGGTDNSGRTFDWGHPLTAANQLTSQALIGWGYGNTQNNPSFDSFNVVWVTALEDATINIDFDGDGVVDNTVSVSALESIKIVDDSSVYSGAEDDQDMTGAIIFAADPSNDLSNPVDIAVAWGQSPADTDGPGTADQGRSLDLGTVIPALPIVEAGKTSQLETDADGDGEISPGDTLLYSINIVNIGQVDLPAGSFNVLDFFSPVFDDATYVLNSTEYDDNGDGIPDSPIADVGSTAFPLDESGFTNTVALPKGGNQIITFKVKIDEFGDLTAGTDTIINQGVLRPPGGGDPLDEFETEDPLNFEPAIEIQKTVASGHDNGASFGSSGELITGAPGAEVTYYFKVTNTGATDLNSIEIDDNDLGISINDLTLLSGTPGDGLAPGDMAVYFYETTINGDLINTATTTANPTYADGTDLDVDGDGQDNDDVTDDDTAEVEEIPNGSISGTVFEDTDNNDTGDTPLEGVTITLLDDQGATVDTTTTDANGDYIFTDVAPGDYQVVETNLPGYQDVSEVDGGNDGGDDTDGGNNNIVNNIPVILTPGENDTGNDFVDEQVGTISGTVFEDTDNDGTGDTTLEGVTVTLLDDQGQTVDTTTTGSDGTYSFTDVEPGNYEVVQTNLPGYQDVSEVDGQNDGGDDTDGGSNNIANNIPVILDPGENDTGNDFVDEQVGTISGTVFEDTDNNG
ncbi:MAG: Cna B-type domain-containing protein, partial [Okeania sp. SIO2C9]|uniref:SdrD B-like domain-containing protein n=1 Tax=Okeania sp. SIO2C9 TaxID=2607791 RepID=UPI0013C1FB86